MKSAVDRSRHLTDLLSVAATRAGIPPPPRAQALTANAVSAPPLPSPPPDVVAWLAQLMLLYGLPFEYLAPAPSMLPPESIRFFFLDQNWTDRLIDGAASVGVSSTMEQLATYATLEELVLQAALAAPTVRASLLGQPAPPAATPAGPITGFLLRSAVVSGWPGLEVAAIDSGGKSLIPPLRFERLSPDVLLCLFNGLPVEVDLKQPSETLHFGVVEDKSGAPQATLRYVSGASAGMQIDTDECAIVRRNGDAPTTVVNVQKTAIALANALIEKNALPTGSALTAAQFAIEMVQSAGLQPFKKILPTATRPTA